MDYVGIGARGPPSDEGANFGKGKGKGKKGKSRKGKGKGKSKGNGTVDRYEAIGVQCVVFFAIGAQGRWWVQVDGVWYAAS